MDTAIYRKVIYLLQVFANQQRLTYIAVLQLPVASKRISVLSSAITAFQILNV